MSSNQKISMVHIGLMKTATTTLQNLWLQDTRVSLVHKGLLQIIQKARVTGRNAKSGAAVPLQWQYDSKPEPGQHIVLSQEALSTAYINERASKADIKRFQKAAAKILSMIVPSPKILITVREPASWIKSIYNQSVKMGGIDTFPDFLKMEKDFIKQSLNIVDLKETWGEFFGKENILVLPIELMRNNKALFFEEIFKFSGVPVPDLTVEIAANPSMKEEHLKLMKRFNEWVDIFTRYGIYQRQIPQQAQQALNIIRFAVRYSLESPSAELLEKVADTESRLPDCDIDLSHIDSEFLSKIRVSYQKVLIDNDFYGFRDLYCGQ